MAGTAASLEKARAAKAKKRAEQRARVRQRLRDVAEQMQKYRGRRPTIVEFVTDAVLLGSVIGPVSPYQLVLLKAVFFFFIYSA
jgi:Flp pilus assembly protein TadB